MKYVFGHKDDKYRAFGYDPKYQLKAETFWSAKVPGTRSDALLWSYDGNGNRLTQHDSGVLTPYVYGDNNEMTDAGSEEFTFDHFGNTASIVNTESYSYDFEGHMTQREDLSIEAIDNHEYDGNGRRMRSKLNSAANWTNFIHDELTENLICEYTLVSGTYTIKALNTYGIGLISSNREGTIRYFHFDGLGSTAHLTDTSQDITDSYSYNAFGVPYTPIGSSVNPYRYVGQWGYYDDGALGSSSGMLLLGVRYYWPKYGRLSTWDSFASTNAYLYAEGSPTILIDPNGHIALAAPIVIEIAIFVGIAALAVNAVRNYTDCSIELPSFPDFRWGGKGPASAPPPSGARPDTGRPYPRIAGRERVEPFPFAKPKPNERDRECRAKKIACLEACSGHRTERGFLWELCCLQWCDLSERRCSRGLLPNTWTCQDRSRRIVGKPAW